jgi:hypothetical protein
LPQLPRGGPRTIYCHSCITALASVMGLLRREFKHDPGFVEWEKQVKARLEADPEFEYLKRARNYVIHEGALQPLASNEIKMDGAMPAGLEIRGRGPDGPDVWAPNSTGGMIPVDWRRLPGFEYQTHLRIAPARGLPDPPSRELKEMLAEKIEILDKIVTDAEERFPGGYDWDPELEAQIEAHADELDS